MVVVPRLLRQLKTELSPKLQSIYRGLNTPKAIVIAPPITPFVVNEVNGNLEVQYASAPSNATVVEATYKTLEPSIIGALSEASSHWLELSVDGVVQNPRERILSVPFAQVAGEAVEKNYNISNYLIRENGKTYNESFPGFILVQPKYGKGLSGDVKIGPDSNALVTVSSYTSSRDIQMPSVQSRPTSSIIPLPNGFYWRASGYDSVMFIPVGSQDLSSFEEQFLFSRDTDSTETQDNDGDGVSDNEDTSPNGPSEIIFSEGFHLIEGSFTWEEARLDAIDKGGQLAKLDSAEKNNLAHDHLSEYFALDRC